MNAASERVLVVHADDASRADLASHLAAEGHGVTVVAAADDALAILPALQPTVAIADLAAGGSRLVEAMRDGGARDVPVIVLGDPGHAAEFEALLDMGHVRYLARDTEWEHFRRTFDTLRTQSEPDISR